MNCDSRNNPDYISDILDEIALEGLDGITLEALWLRLKFRPRFCFKIDENSKNFIWKNLLCLEDINFYELPEPRASLNYYDYSISDDSEKASLELDEVYPYCNLKNASGVFGSCKYYFTRTDLSNEVSEKTLEEAQNKWGNKLVVVASQEIRTLALVGKCSSVDFNKNSFQYDILERIGRCRQLGLTTCGKGSLQSVVEDPKSIFHYLKFLYRHKLVKKQSLIGDLNAASNASRVHLTRFFEESLHGSMAILQTAIEELKSRPNYMISCDEFYGLFDSKKKKRVKKFKKTALFKKYITLTKNLPYRSFFPEANQSEWERKSKNGERIVRCFQLINPDVELSDLIEKDCVDVDEDNEIPEFLPKGIYYINMPIVAQVYHHIKNSGASGLSNGELALIMGVNARFVRGIIKRLISENFCKFYIENTGRQRIKRFIVGENIQAKAAATELVQILAENNHGSSVPIEGETSQQEDVKPVPCENLNISHLHEKNVSYRSLRRLGMIIKTIKTHRYRLFYQIAKYIHEEEVKEEVPVKIDRGTINRMLKKLENDKIIKIITLTGKDDSDKVVKIFADLTFELDEKLAETLYHAHSSYNGMESKSLISKKESILENEFSQVLMENLAEMKKLFDGVKRDSEKPSDFKECDLAYSPKFMRLNILHDLIFHLVYDYTGIVDKKQEEMIEELSKTTAIDEDLRKEMPKLYGTHPSTYMFVPPLKSSEKFPGWFLISDVILRMPFSVIVKTIRICESSPEFWKYLHHPVRKHILVKDLPLTIRQILFDRKNQLNSLYYDFRRLCFIGLIQYGTKFRREYFQTFLYLNRRASLLDTSTSPAEYFQVPADIEFEKKFYYFQSKSDIKKYWMDMFNICMGTNLGVKANMIGKEILAEREITKESLKHLTKAKSIEEVVEGDDGRLPGDNRGAAGLDSVMFSFLRNNWTGPVNKMPEKLKGKSIAKVPLLKIKKEQIKKRLLLKKNRRKKVCVKIEKPGVSYPTDLPPSAKFRKIKEREIKFQRKRNVNYDEIDLEALKLMNTLRVTWSTAEDNFLLICRVAMLFLCPKSRNFVRIPWVEVRKAIQAKIPESRNKTQKAIARRIIYMLKNPTTSRSVQLCLEELKGMPEAWERFDCTDLHDSIKPSAPNLTELQNRLFEKFHDLVAFLKDRFIETTNLNIAKSDEDLIPNSLEEFFEKFQFDTEPKYVTTVKIIRENVIRGVLMSSLSCRADKTSSAVQLFDIYRQYTDDELQNAIKKLNSDKVITISKKMGNSIFRSGKILPLSFTPYKLSFAFRYLLNSKYNHQIYSDTFLQTSNLLQMNEEEFEVYLNDCNIALFLLASKDLTSFRAVLPEQIILFDRVKLSDDTYSRILQRYCEMLQFSSSNSKVVCSSGKVITKSDGDETFVVGGDRKRTLLSTDKIDAKKAKVNTEKLEKKEPAKQSEVTTEASSSEEVEGEQAVGDEVVGEIVVNEKVEDEKVDNEKDLLSPEKTTRSSRVILYMMREEAKKNANESGKVGQEFCVVNASTVFCKFEKSSLENYVKSMSPKISEAICKSIVNRALAPTSLVDEQSVMLSTTNFDVELLKKVVDFIASKKELGATNEDLTLCFSEDICGGLKYLIESKVIVKTGITETRYISQKYSTPWLLNSFKMTRLEREKLKPEEVKAISLSEPKEKEKERTVEEVVVKKKRKIMSSEEMKSDSYVPPSCSTEANNKIKVLIRPWIRIDGSLNRKVLDRFLGSILGYIMVSPGVSIQRIMNKFSPSITPVWTKDLIEILFEIGCISYKCVTVTKKANLFTKSEVNISNTVTGLENDDSISVEANIDSVIKLSLFIGKKSYSKDFLIM